MPVLLYHTPQRDRQATISTSVGLVSKAVAHAPCLLVLEITRCVLDLVHTVLVVIDDGYLLQL